MDSHEHILRIPFRLCFYRHLLHSDRSASRSGEPQSEFSYKECSLFPSPILLVCENSFAFMCSYLVPLFSSCRLSIYLYLPTTPAAMLFPLSVFFFFTVVCLPRSWNLLIPSKISRQKVFSSLFSFDKEPSVSTVSTRCLSDHFKPFLYRLPVSLCFLSISLCVIIASTTWQDMLSKIVVCIPQSIVPPYTREFAIYPSRYQAVETPC